MLHPLRYVWPLLYRLWLSLWPMLFLSGWEVVISEDDSFSLFSADSTFYNSSFTHSCPWKKHNNFLTNSDKLCTDLLTGRNMTTFLLVLIGSIVLAEASSHCSLFESNAKTCLEPLMQFGNGPPSKSEICPVFQVAERCMNRLLELCSDPPDSPSLHMWRQSAGQMNQLCADIGTEPDADNLLPCSDFDSNTEKCIRDLKNFTDGPPSKSQICPAFQDAEWCVNALLEWCSDPPDSPYFNMWRQSSGQLKQLCADIGTDTDAGTASNCSQFEANAQSCIEPLMQFSNGPPSKSEICPVFQVAERCMNLLLELCSDPPESRSLNMLRQSAGHMNEFCAGIGAEPDAGNASSYCSLFESNAQKCLEPMMQFSNGPPSKAEICPVFQVAERCMNRLLELCSDPPDSPSLHMWRQSSGQMIQLCTDIGPDPDTGTPSPAQCPWFMSDAQACMRNFTAATQSGQAPNMTQVCKALNQTTICMDRIIRNCSNPPEAMVNSWNQVKQSLGPQCNISTGPSSACSQFESKVQTCIAPLNDAGRGQKTLEAICLVFTPAQECMKRVLEECSNPPASRLLTQWRMLSSQMSSVCTNTGNPCDRVEVDAMNCMRPLLEAGSTGLDARAICGLLNETTVCMNKVLEGCPFPPAGSQAMSTWTHLYESVEQVCLSLAPDSGQCPGFITGAQTCMQNITAATQSRRAPDISKLCTMMHQTGICMDNLIGTCSDPPANGKEMVKAWLQMRQSVGPMCNTPTGPESSCIEADLRGYTCLKLVLNVMRTESPNLSAVCQKVSDAGPCVLKVIEHCPTEATNTKSSWTKMAKLCNH